MVHAVHLDEGHRYWTPGGTSETGSRQVPGFSELCAAMGVTKPNPFWTAQGREEGIALHKYLQFMVRGGTPAPADPRIAGRVAGIQKFIRDTGVKFVGGEEPRYDPATGVACTKDLWCLIGSWAYVVDAKRGAKMKSHLLQTACQKIVLTANDFRPQKRAALYLRDNGYRFIEHDDREDETRWKAIAAGYHALTPEQRKQFALDAENITGLDEKTWRIVNNARAARSHYL